MANYKGAASEAGRAMQIQKKREREKEDLELRKKKIEGDLKLSVIGNKFKTHYDAIEQQLKSSTVGLVTLDEMKAKQEDFVKERERQLAQKTEEKRIKEIEEKTKLKEQQRKQIKTLSFKFDDEDDDDHESDSNSNSAAEPVKIKEEDVEIKKEPVDGDEGDSSSNQVKEEQGQSDAESSQDAKPTAIKKRRIVKNPDVDTSFLPDRDREDEERLLRETLRMEWEEKQEKMKNEDIEITFSYWDGSGHRRAAMMKKGNNIYQFLQKALDLLRGEFHDLRVVSADQLMYVKEDLIIPHHYSFYDFIVTKARGKSGPLFNFDVHDDIRLLADVSVEKDESHAGKVLLRGWYERNKHIFPASRWEPYDPTKSYDKYTIKDTKK